MYRYIAGLMLATALVTGLTSCSGRHARDGRGTVAGESSMVDYTKKKPLRVKFYLERSGSMIAYDSPRGDGSFKAAIVTMLNNLPGKHNRLFVVNDGIYPYPKGIDQFVSDGNIFESTKGIGDPSYTDFKKIFDNLLNKTGQGELSVLVTDMIYSVKTMVGVNPQKIFADAQGMVSSVFKENVKDKSLLVVQMQGSYNGSYYAYDAPAKGWNYDGKRPYYILVCGTNASFRQLSQDERYAKFRNFEAMSGFQNEMLFTAYGHDNVFAPYCSFLMATKEIQGRFKPGREGGNGITKLVDMRPDRETGKLRLALAVDLAGMMMPETYLQDPKNYRVASDDQVTIREIRKVTERDRTPAEKKYIGQATHIMILEIDEIHHHQNVEISLKKAFPNWIALSSTDDDTNRQSGLFGKQTFGLKYLLKGIDEAYTRVSDQPYYFTLSLRFEK